MVNEKDGQGQGATGASALPLQPERNLALAYVSAARRGALEALFALDAALSDVVRTTTEPLIGQMRLTWWHDALTKLDSAPPPAHPVLEAIARNLLPAGVRGSDVAATVDGWDVLIEEARLDEPALRRFGEGRGGTLFALAATAMGGDPSPAIRAAGAGWALGDLADHLSNAAEVELARSVARDQMQHGLGRPWPSSVRPLGMLAHFARMDLEGGSPAGSPKRLMRVVWHRLSGR